MSTHILSAIDVGSNSVRMMLAAESDGHIAVLNTQRITTRLLNGVENGLLSGESVDRTAQAVAELCGMARAQGADLIDAFGTSALRDAQNREDFSDRTEELCGLRVKLISGVEEAQLAYAGAGPEGKCGVIDIGGGSTELIVGNDGQMLRAHSAQLGAVRLAGELCGREDPDEMCALAETRLHETVDIVCTDHPDKWIGVGGTITTLAAMTKRVARYSPDAIDNFPLTEETVESWLHALCEMPVEERRLLVGINPQRADIIAHGTAILLTVMRMTHAGTVHACDHDNLEGYIRRCMLPRLHAQS